MRARALLLSLLVIAATLGAAAPATSTPPPVGSRLCADLAASRVTVENIGDSIASGTYVPHQADRWWHLLSRALPGGGTVWSGAVGGSLLRQYLPAARGGTGELAFHLDYARAVRPTVLMVSARINEQWNAIPIATFKQTVRDVVGYVREASPDTTVILHLSPLVLDPLLDQVAGAPKQTDYLRALRELGAELPNTLVVDWGAFFPKALPDWVGLFYSDGGHPSPSGNRVQAAATHTAILAHCGATS